VNTISNAEVKEIIDIIVAYLHIFNASVIYYWFVGYSE